MQNNKSIEDIFNQGLSDVKVDPSSNAWTGIDQQLDDLAMESLFKNNLSDVSIQPNSGVWNAIASQLPKASFWQFSTHSVNVYSVAALFAIITGLAIISVPLLEKEEVSSLVIEPIEIAQNVISETEVVSKSIDSEGSESGAIASDKAFSENSENVINSSSDFSGNGIQPNNNNSNYQEYYSIIDDDNNDIEPENDKDKKTSKSTKKEDKLIKDKPRLINADLKNSESIVKPQSLIVNEKELTEYNDPELKSLVHVDTLVVFDTVQFYDTVLIEKKIKINKTKRKSFNQRGNWSAQVHAGVFTSKPEYLSNASEYDGLADTYNSASTGSFSYSYGLGVNYDYDKFRISSGFTYTSIQEEFNYETHRVETKPIVKHNLTENGHFLKIEKNIEYVYDPQYVQRDDTVSRTYTVKKIEFPTYIVIDTIWRYKIEPKLVHVSDSVKIETFDTVRVVTYDTTYYNTTDTNIYSTYYENVNKYTYLEIPLSFGYAINFNKFTLRPTAGALFSFMLNAKGKGISMLNREEVYSLPDANLPMMNVQVSMLLGLGIEYELQNNFSVFLQPYYRRTLSSVYKKASPLDKTISGFGTNFGVTVYF